MQLGDVAKILERAVDTLRDLERQGRPTGSPAGPRWTVSAHPPGHRAPAAIPDHTTNEDQRSAMPHRDPGEPEDPTRRPPIPAQEFLAASVEAFCALWSWREAQISLNVNSSEWSEAVRAEYEALLNGDVAVRLPDGTRWMSSLALARAFPDALSPTLEEILDGHVRDDEQHRGHFAYFFETWLEIPSLDPRHIYCTWCHRWLNFEPEWRESVATRVLGRRRDG